MGINVQNYDSWLEVKLVGRTDSANFAETKAYLDSLTAPGKSVALDVTRAEFINFQMIKYLHQLAIDVREQGGVVALVGATEKLKKQFRVFASLDPIVTFTTSEWVEEINHTPIGRA